MSTVYFITYYHSLVLHFFMISASAHDQHFGIGAPLRLLRSTIFLFFFRNCFYKKCFYSLRETELPLKMVIRRDMDVCFLSLSDNTCKPRKAHLALVSQTATKKNSRRSYVGWLKIPVVDHLCPEGLLTIVHLFYFTCTTNENIFRHL